MIGIRQGEGRDRVWVYIGLVGWGVDQYPTCTTGRHSDRDNLLYILLNLVTGILLYLKAYILL